MMTRITGQCRRRTEFKDSAKRTRRLLPWAFPDLETLESASLRQVEIQRLNPQQFDKFRDFIYKKCGIRMDSKKVLLLSNRIRRRLKAGNFATFDDYYRFLRSSSGTAEIEFFLDAVTTNETFFFRTTKHFDWLTTEFLDELIADERHGRRKPNLRIWSAGCSNGAEPYSIAICLAENNYQLRDWSLQIVGTDISEEALREAHRGTYKTRAMESVNEKQRRRFFRHQVADDLWTIRPEITNLVEFKQHNLIHPPPGNRFDCIFIRNVLIYFDSESKQLVIDHLVRALADGGYLVVGPSEGISGMLEPLKKVSPTIYQKLDPSHTSPGRQEHVQR
jgi:chemotaxis protein methyltransferase CheR